MLRSMTGFGDASTEVDGVHFFIEVRSLNNKYFKATIRLPEEYQGLEAEIESELRQRLNRGSITVRATCTDASASAAYEINCSALERYLAQIMGVEQVRTGAFSVDIGTLLALPGVLQPPTNEEARLDRARAAFKKVLHLACDHLISMRTREGALLREDLLAHQQVIAKRLEDMQARAPDVVREYEQRLRTRLDALVRDAGLKVEPAEFVREVAVFAERTDIAEELSRLRGHIEQFNDLVGAGDGRPVGRTLDFLAQEMLREANTIASKSTDSEISRAIIEVKGAIDRIKEQAQNVE
ncbi:MAG: YicC family protein [Phycisphaeraceae bacterium]|nr:YicC family protein [Phycisphaeraceae bacterium]MCW5753556.1 YicC family protein [Phycisphaeraceae bacterium]